MRGVSPSTRRRQLQAWRGGATPLRRWLPTWKYFHRTGSCSVWVRALRQCRSRLYWPSVERVPPSSCSLLVARIAISVVRTLASATLTAVSATASSLGSSRIPSIARPARSKQSFGGVELHFEIADLRYGEDVLVAVLLAAIDPRPHMIAHKTDRLLDRAPRDTGVHRRLDDLRDRSVRGGTHAAKIGGDHSLRARRGHC